MELLLKLASSDVLPDTRSTRDRVRRDLDGRGLVVQQGAVGAGPAPGQFRRPLSACGGFDQLDAEPDSQAHL
jgi:hypothetical protein